VAAVAAEAWRNSRRPRREERVFMYGMSGGKIGATGGPFNVGV